MRNQPTVNTSVWTPDGQLYVTQGDRLYIDPELNTASRNPYGAATDDDLHDVSQLILIEGRFYDLSVSPAGDKLSLEPSDVAVGYVSNPNQGFRAVVYGDKGFLKVRGDGSGKAPLPVGLWKLQAYMLDRTGMAVPKKTDSKAEPSVIDILMQALGPTVAARAPRSTCGRIGSADNCCGAPAKPRGVSSPDDGENPFRQFSILRAGESTGPNPGEVVSANASLPANVAELKEENSRIPNASRAEGIAWGAFSRQSANSVAVRRFFRVARL